MTLSSCVPKIYTAFYSIGEGYGFGFGQDWFPRKVLKRIGWRWRVLAVQGGETVAVLNNDLVTNSDFRI